MSIFYKNIKSRKLSAFLQKKGFIRTGGSKHNKYSNKDNPNIKIIVPRHRIISAGVTDSICKSLINKFEISEQEIIENLFK